MNHREFVWPVRVYYEDTDAGGVVYHANYLKFMERARSEWLRQLGFEQDDLARNENMVFAVRQATVDFFKPARFNERLQIISGISDKGPASFLFTQRITNQSGITICKGEVKIACLDTETFRPRRIPELILAEFENAG